MLTRNEIKARAKLKVEAEKRGKVVKQSLNPEREKEDARQYLITINNIELKQELEHAWNIVLRNGKALRTGRCEAKRIQLYAIECGYGTEKRYLNIVTEALDMIIDDENQVEFGGFVRALYYLAFGRYNMEGDYQNALQKIMNEFVRPYNIKHKQLQASDGSESDEQLLAIPEMDRLLYVYDKIFDRLFHKYRDWDKHGNRALTLDQNLVLDNFVEVEELKELMRCYKYFPSLVAFSDISAASQYACFGIIVVDPTKQGAGILSAIDAHRGAAEHVPKIAGVADEAAEAYRPEVLDLVTKNYLYVPQLPPEFLTKEAILDKPRFMSAMVRLAQIIFSRSDYTDHYPTKTSRVEAMLHQMEGTYEKMFGVTMENDCDYTIIGIPYLSVNNPFEPPMGSMSGFELQIAGGSFCPKRGVFVRFGDPGPESLVVRTKSVTRRKIVVDAPCMTPKDYDVDVEYVKATEEYKLSMNRIRKVKIECSNNRWQYSITKPPQYITFKRKIAPKTCNEDKSKKLLKLFQAVCSYCDATNIGLMTKEKWCTLKKVGELVEPAIETFFLEISEFHDNVHGLSLDFEGFLRVACLTLREMIQERWLEGLYELAERIFDTEQRQKVKAEEVEDRSDITLARKAIAMFERRKQVEIDIYCGPVLCGTVYGRPGNVMSCTGHTGGLTSEPVFVMTHPTLDISLCDLFTEPIILSIIFQSHSVFHLLKRVIAAGFDAAPHDADCLKTRYPAGRCWSISNAVEEKKGAKKNKRKIGAFWDYPGNYSNLEWQPEANQMHHKYLTGCTYVEERDLDYVLVYICFALAKNVDEMREMLRAKGYVVSSVIYKPP